MTGDAVTHRELECSRHPRVVSLVVRDVLVLERGVEAYPALSEAAVAGLDAQSARHTAEGLLQRLERLRPVVWRDGEGTRGGLGTGQAVARSVLDRPNG